MQAAERLFFKPNKGHKMIYCLRQEDNSFVPFNTLLYVGLHELGHIMTQEKDTKRHTHSKEFWQNFGLLLRTARNMGM